MQELIFSVVKNSLSITFFVLAMMLFIEYVNVRTQGAFCRKIQKRGWQQVVIGVLFGLFPGCLGTYTVVTLYSHNLASLGALFATFVATMGDEAFLLFSLDLSTALRVSAVLVAIAVVGGFLIDFVWKRSESTCEPTHFEIHEHDDDAHEHSWTSSIQENVLHPSSQRAMLLFGVLLIFVLSVLGEIGHSHDVFPGLEHVGHEHHIDWFSMTFVCLSLATAYVIAIVPEHFLQTHFWEHIIKKHFWKILGWTTCIIAIVHVVDSWVELQNVVSQYQWQILIAAVLIGLIPESGPHIIFISLYLSGHIPFAILLANAIVQDGHGGLPLFAESPKTFVLLKLAKSVIALVLGFILL
ncbi:MAG: arsenic efflux protein [Bacteroidales bacterium]|nr:arsenic efflux protein [Bacteroidales bacterium]